MLAAGGPAAAVPITFINLVDTNTDIPDGVGTFTGFGGVDDPGLPGGGPKFDGGDLALN